MPDLDAFLHAFIPLFVAVDAIGITPIYLRLTRSLSDAERRAMLRGSLVVAAGVSIAFALLGKAVFVFLGITIADFQIAGGFVLLALAALDLLGAEPRGLAEGTDVGIVPIAVPLIAGPGVITSVISSTSMERWLRSPGCSPTSPSAGCCWRTPRDSPGCLAGPVHAPSRRSSACSSPRSA